MLELTITGLMVSCFVGFNVFVLATLGTNGWLYTHAYNYQMVVDNAKAFAVYIATNIIMMATALYFDWLIFTACLIALIAIEHIVRLAAYKLIPNNLKSI